MGRGTARRTCMFGAGVLLSCAFVGSAGQASAAPLPSTTGPLTTYAVTARSGHAIAPPGTLAALPADAPFNVTDQITDRAGVLGGEVDSLKSVLDDLRSQHQLQLFVVYVDSFDGASGETWAQQTFSESGMGGDDVLLAVAVKDRRYGAYTTPESGLTPEQDNIVRSNYIEPELASDDWAGAVRAAADGYGKATTGEISGGAGGIDGGSGSDGSGGDGFSPWWLLVPAGGVALFALSRRRKGVAGQRGPGPQGAPLVPTDELSKQTAAALVQVDDAIRASAEELTFAEAQFGVQATQRFKTALNDAKTKAAEAFRLQLEIDDLRHAGRLDEYSHRERLERILELTSAADTVLDEQEAEFARLRNLQATVPQFLGELGMRLEEVRRRLPAAEQELAGLGAQYPPEALETVSGNVRQAEQLLTAAGGFIEQGQEHLQDGDDRPAAVAAARAAEDAIGQADQLLTSVTGARQELTEAATRLDAALASISSDMADADRFQADDQLTQTALAAAKNAIAQGIAARSDGDPLAALRDLARAEKDLDNALARYREAEEQATRARQRFDQRIAQVRARLASIDELISSRRGAVGTSARTHIANAHHLCEQAATVAAGSASAPIGADATNALAHAGALLDQAEAEGEQALRVAQDDINNWGGYAGGGPGSVPGPRGLDPTSLILGGILSGGFGGGWGGGGGRGGGWGGSSGGFGGGIGGGGFGGGGRF